MNKYILHSLFLFFSGIALAQVELKVDTTHIRIGEQIHYVISADKQEKIQFPKLQLDSLGKMEVVHSLPIDTIKNRLYKKYILTSFDSGTYTIPKQLILIDKKQFYIDSLLINVGTVVVDTTKQKLFPIKGIYKAPPKTWHDYIYYLWWLLGGLVLGVILWWFILRLKKSDKKNRQKQLTPIEKALSQFQILDKKDLLEQEKIKEYYVELTEIVRDYIGKDVQIPTMEVTTDELITLLELHNKSKQIGIDKERIQQLHSFLKEADLVKFAKYKPELIQIQENRKTAELIINEIQEQIHKPVLDELGREIIVDTPEEIERKALKKRRTIGLLIAGGIVLLVLALSTWYYGIRYVKDSLIGHPTKELLEGEWYQSSYGHPAISAETPKVLKAHELRIPEEMKQAIISNGTFEYGSLLSGFQIMFSIIEFNPEVDFNIENAVTNAVKLIEAQEGVSNFTYEVTDIEHKGIKGKEIIGTLEYKHIKMHYVQQLYMNGQALQQIVIARKEQDAYAEKIQKRVFESIKLQINDDEKEE